MINAVRAKVDVNTNIITEIRFPSPLAGIPKALNMHLSYFIVYLWIFSFLLKEDNLWEMNVSSNVFIKTFELY